jgi:hypothetical protein
MSEQKLTHWLMEQWTKPFFQGPREGDILVDMCSYMCSYICAMEPWKESNNVSGEKSSLEQMMLNKTYFSAFQYPSV